MLPRGSTLAAIAATARMGASLDPRFSIRAASGGACSIARSSSVRSRADCQRFSGSFARALWTTRSSAGGVAGAVAAIRGGWSFRMAPVRDAWVAPPNGRCPVAIS